MEVKDAAIEYVEQGLSVIPIQRGTKKPCCPWSEYQHRVPTEEEVESWFDTWPDAQLALVTGNVSGVAAIDLDNKQAVEWAKKNLPRTGILQRTRKGWHLFYRTNGEPIPNKAKIIDGVDVRGDGGYVLIDPSEHEEGGHYTLQVKPSFDWSNLPYFPKDHLPQQDRPEREPVTLDPAPEGSRNASLARIAGRYFAKGLQYEEVLALCKGWNTGLENPLDTEEVEKTVQSIEKKHLSEQDKSDKSDKSDSSDTFGQIQTDSDSVGQYQTVSDSSARRFKGNIKDAIAQFVEERQGFFFTQDIDNELELRHRQDKKNRSWALAQMEKERYIKRDRRDSRKWHILKTELNFIDLEDTDESPFQIDLPLNLPQMVNLPPKCVVVLAGAPNAGKTAFMLEVLKRNLSQQYPLLYLMSEMGPSEYKQRVQKIADDPRYWNRRVQAASLSTGFDGAITQYNPNGLTVIDYLEEVEGEYYRLASDIRSIYDSLGEGIALIALQKRSQNEMGVGGEGTAEKARLYMTMDKLAHQPRSTISALKIIKAKDYPDENPNGKECHVEIQAGKDIVPVSDWMYCNTKQREQWINRYQHMVEQGLDIAPEGDKEVVYRFLLDDGSYGNLRRKDYAKWSESFGDRVDIDEILSSMQSYSENKVALQRKGWFFQLSNILKDAYNNG